MQKLTHSVRLFPAKTDPTDSAKLSNIDECTPGAESKAIDLSTNGNSSGMSSVSPAPATPTDRVGTVASEESSDMSTELAILADEINHHHHECEVSFTTGANHAIEAGRLLLDAKKRCAHGDWGPWLGANFAGSKRTAQIYIQLAKDPAILGANAQRVSHLSLRSAAAQLSRSDLDADDPDTIPTPEGVQSADTDADTQGQAVAFESVPSETHSQLQELTDKARSLPEFQACQARIAALQRELSESETRCRKLQSDIEQAQHELDVAIQNWRHRQLELDEGTASADPGSAAQQDSDALPAERDEGGD
jgi:hypothetical protein